MGWISRFLKKTESNMIIENREEKKRIARLVGSKSLKLSLIYGAKRILAKSMLCI